MKKIKSPLLKYVKAAEEAWSIDDLYDIDVNKKKRNITEEAHPDLKVGFDSYDPVNSVLKNDNQKQDLTINILNRKQHGILVNEIYASKARLIGSLVKTANTLESHDAGLTLYCDNIIRALDNEKMPDKVAAAQLAVMPFLAIPAGVVAIMYFQQHLPAFSSGVERDIKNMQAEIKDMLDDSAGSLIGRTYTDSFKSKLNFAYTNLTKIGNAFQFIKQRLSQMILPKNGEELLETKDDPKNEQTIQYFDKFTEMSLAMIQYLNKFKVAMQNQDMKEMQIQQKGKLQQLIDDTHILSGRYGLIRDDIDDMIRFVDPLVGSLTKMIETIKQAKEKSNEVVEAAIQTVQSKEQPGKSDLDDSEKSIKEMSEAFN